LPLRTDGDGVLVPVRVVPRAKRNEIESVVQGALRVRLNAPPVDGAANRALCLFLAEVFELPRRGVELVAGEKARQKTVRLRGLTEAAVRQRLASLLNS